MNRRRFCLQKGGSREHISLITVSLSHLPVIVASYTMNHIVDTSPLTKFEGGLNLLHDGDYDAVIWLKSTATAVLMK